MVSDIQEKKKKTEFNSSVVKAFTAKQKRSLIIEQLIAMGEMRAFCESGQQINRCPQNKRC